MTVQPIIRYFGMNAVELGLFGCAVIVLVVYAGLETRFKDWKTAVGSVLVLLLPLYLAVESTTGFLTIDAAYNIFPEVAHLRTAEMTQFRLGAFRTSEMFLGPLVLAAQSWIDNPYRLAMGLKALHWIVGFGLLLWIHRISRRWAGGDPRTYFLLYMIVALLLPSNLLALKVFNYDKMSLLLATLGVFYLVAAWVDRRMLPAAGGLICLALAAQEKLIAAPLVWLAMPVFAGLYVDDRSRRTPTPKDYAAGSLAALAIVLAIYGATYLAVAALRGSFDGLPPSSVLRPLQTAFAPLFRSIYEWRSPSAALLLLVGCGLFTGVAAVGIRHLLCSKTGPLLTESLSKKGYGGAVIYAFALLAIATVWAHGGDIYLGPMRAVSGGHYTPTVSFNEAYWHFDTETAWQYGMRLIAADVAVFVACLPSALWLAMLAWIWLRRRAGGAPCQAALGPLGLVAWIALAAPLAFALTRLPVGPRYFNLFVFWLSIIVVIGLNSRLTSRGRKIAAVSGMLALLLVEVMPFGPLYGAYAPVWLQGGDPTFERRFEPGRLGPLSRWPGWGEAVMLAGRRIERECRPQDCDAVRLYTAYPGVWLDPVRISPRRVFIIGNGDHLSYTPNDYFIVNRAAVIQKWVRLPAGVAPHSTIAFGDYVQAYVYRGDALAEAGFQFRPVP